MKKIISLILSTVLLLSLCVPVFAADFADFTSAHWAYDYVTALVNDGTINGYADGTFRPEGTVTRAEFVKMIGMGPETRTEIFDDVPASHWAYAYIMSSGLNALKDNTFAPDTPITRGDVANLLWKRAGSVKGITTPPIIHRQGSNFDAISWVYTNSIMVGDDYVDLRLNDTLTRAEASALIIRSRNVTDATEKTILADKLDPEIYEEVYNAFKLTDRAYNADATVTNGELAMAAARLQCGYDSPTYPNVSATVSFEHPYAQPINMLCRYYLGMENDNAAYADKTATLKEAVAAMMFATFKSANAYISSGTGETYPTYTASGNEKFDNMINAAYVNGIWFTTPDAMDMDKNVTMKELATLVLELNGFSGFHRVSVINSSKTELKNAKIRTDIANYPSNEAYYRIILANVPNRFYEAPFVSGISAPEFSYEVTNSFRSIFTSMFSTWVRALSSVGYELEVTYYPGVAVDNGNGYTLRVAIVFKNIPQNTRLGDLINCVNAADGNLIVNTGDTIYADVDTGKKIDGVVTGINDMILSQIIY